MPSDDAAIDARPEPAARLPSHIARAIATQLGFGRRVASARFVVFLLLFGSTAAAVWSSVGTLRCVLIGFDVAALLFVVSLIPVLRAPSAHVMRGHARANDANRVMLLVVTVAVMLVVLASVRGVLSGPLTSRPATAVLVVVTLGLCWLFSNSVYALHYAHLYYGDRDEQGGDDRGLLFPSTHEPQYTDFVYFSFTIGMTFQTSDVQIGSPVMRQVVTFHALAAFVFDIGVVAFAINVFGSRQG